MLISPGHGKWEEGKWGESRGKERWGWGEIIKGEEVMGNLKRENLKWWEKLRWNEGSGSRGKYEKWGWEGVGEVRETLEIGKNVHDLGRISYEPEVKSECSPGSPVFARCILLDSDFIWICRMWPLRSIGSYVRSRHGPLCLSDIDLWRTLRPMQTRFVRSSGRCRLQALCLHARFLQVTMFTERPVPLQGRLRRPQVRAMCQRLLWLPQMSPL